jgi:hypothetical protein
MPFTIQQTILSPIRSIALLILFVAGAQTTALSQEPQGPGQGDVTAGDGRCHYNGTRSEQQRRKTFPFGKAQKIVVIAFDCSLGKAPLTNDTINASKVVQQITLTEEQINGLTDILYNYNIAEGTTFFPAVESCNKPEHAIVFLDKADKVIAAIEFCFAQNTRRTTLPIKSTGDFCLGKVELVKSLIQHAGISYFKGGEGCE